MGWRRGGAVLLPSNPDHTGKGRAGGEGERLGEGSRGPPKPKPQPGLTPARCGEGESHGGRTAGQTAPSYEY